MEKGPSFALMAPSGTGADGKEIFPMGKALLVTPAEEPIRETGVMADRKEKARFEFPERWATPANGKTADFTEREPVSCRIGNTTAAGARAKDTVMEPTNAKKELTGATGKTTVSTDTESYTIPMVPCGMRVNGKATSPTVGERLSIPMVSPSKENGKMAFPMERAPCVSLTETTLETGKVGHLTVRGFSPFRMALNIPVSGATTGSTDTGPSPSPTANNIPVVGKTAGGMVRECIPLRTMRNTLAIGNTINGTAGEHSLASTEQPMRVSGRTENL